jgi:RNA polymerase sigma-70 factor (ECF subfamily)
VGLSPEDRELLRRCLNHEAGAWNDFVDRYLGLIYHAIQYTAHLRSVKLQPEDVEDIAADVLLAMLANDLAALRQFRGRCSLPTYLTVIARRTCVQELVRRASAKEAEANRDGKLDAAHERGGGLERLEEVAKLLRKLPRREREVVRMFHLEGRTYEEISTKLNIPINSIGPILSRARDKLRKGS